MKPLAKLAGFACGLALVFAGAAFAGSRINVHPGKPAAEKTPAAGMADRRGRTVRHFDLEHTKRMHLIVVRRDMTGFQHLHPAQNRDGTWSVPATLSAAGTYRVFADFSVRGRAYTLADDLTVDGAVRSRP